MVFFQIDAVRRQSLIGDGAIHLLAGHQALRYGSNTLNLEHPPLVKLLAALPLLGEAPVSPPLLATDPATARAVLFGDAERAQRARLRGGTIIAAAFALPFLAACFFLGRSLDGVSAGIALVLLLGLSYCVFSYLPILQTDTAVSLGFVVAMLAGLAYLRAPSLSTALAIGGAAGLALAAKFSGLLLLPACALAFATASGRSGRRALHGLAAAALMLLVAAAPYAVANWRGDRAASRAAILAYCEGRASLLTGERLRPWCGSLTALNQRSPGAAQWLTGILGVAAQNSVGVYPTYVAGTVRSSGRWWFFPLVLLVRTPLAVLGATLAAVLARGRRRQPMAPRLPRWGTVLIGATVVLYLAAAMGSSYNLGIRHLMPVLPFLYLPAALWAARCRRRIAVLTSCLALEAGCLAPSWMAATNTWWLGAHNPTATLFAAGDMAWGQSYVALAEQARERDLKDLRVVAYGLSQEELAAYLPDGHVMTPGMAIEPGWYALDSALERMAAGFLAANPAEVGELASYASAAREWQPLIETVRRGEDHGPFAGSFRLLQLRAP